MSSESGISSSCLLDAIAFPAMVVHYINGEVSFGDCNEPARRALGDGCVWPSSWRIAIAAVCSGPGMSRQSFRLPTDAGLSAAVASIGSLPDGTGLLMIWQPEEEAAETARRDLAECRAILQDACALARAGYFEYLPDADCMRLSDDLLQLRGASRDCAPRHLADYLASVHPDDLANVRGVFQDADWQTVVFDYRIVTAVGEVRHLHARCRRELDAGGRVLCLRGFEQDDTDRKRDEQRLAYLTQYDALTGLPNRNLFIDRLQQAAARALRHQRTMALMFIDLDRKDVTDTHGHAAADRLLIIEAERLRLCLREEDTIACLGSDEFTVLLEDIDAVEGVEAVARKIVDTLSEPVVIEHGEFFPYVSVGIALYPRETADVNTLLAHGDVAMYYAKDAGRNNFHFFTAELGQRVSQRLSMKNQLRRALDRGEFHLHYQPQVEMQSGRIVGVEALLRWQSEAFGAVSPGCFVPLAEEMGLILPIGEWVIATACQQGQQWQAAGLAPVRMAVNLSARQFRQAALAQQIDRALQVSGLAPEWLELEITEGYLIEDMAASRRVLAMMRERGVHVALDDFGTGYSSFTYLKNLDCDRLKIDGSFIRHLVTPTPDAANSRAIARAIITLAHSLGLQVIAEGVETMEQFKRLRSNGCDIAQGFLFSEPKPGEAVATLLAAGRLPAGAQHAGVIPADFG